MCLYGLTQVTTILLSIPETESAGDREAKCHQEQGVCPQALGEHTED